MEAVKLGAPDREWAGEYAVEKRELFVIDEDGKQHEMEIVKKVLQEKPDQAK